MLLFRANFAMVEPTKFKKNCGNFKFISSLLSFIGSLLLSIVGLKLLSFTLFRIPYIWSFIFRPSLF